jgi:hypothetical protein
MHNYKLALLQKDRPQYLTGIALFSTLDRVKSNLTQAYKLEVAIVYRVLFASICANLANDQTILQNRS